MVSQSMLKYCTETSGTTLLYYKTSYIQCKHCPDLLTWLLSKGLSSPSRGGDANLFHLESETKFTSCNHTIKYMNEWDKQNQR